MMKKIQKYCFFPKMWSKSANLDQICHLSAIKQYDWNFEKIGGKYQDSARCGLRRSSWRTYNSKDTLYFLMWKPKDLGKKTQIAICLGVLIIKVILQ